MAASSSRGAWLALPAVLFIGVLYLAPVLSLLAGSLIEPQPDGSRKFSLVAYRSFFGDPYSLTLLARTLALSLCTVAASLVLAFPVALYLRRLTPARRTLIAMLLLSPLLTSVVVRTLAWVVLLGPNGLLNGFLQWLGLAPVALIYNDLGVVIGLTHVFFGYMLLCLLTSVLKLDPAQLLAASNLGAGPWRQWWHVILPQCRPGIAAGAVLVFTMSASAYVTPVLLGGTQTKVMASEIYDLAISYLEWNEAAVVAAVLFAVVWILVAVLSRVAAEPGRRTRAS